MQKGVFKFQCEEGSRRSRKKEKAIWVEKRRLIREKKSTEERHLEGQGRQTKRYWSQLDFLIERQREGKITREFLRKITIQK